MIPLSMQNQLELRRAPTTTSIRMIVDLMDSIIQLLKMMLNTEMGALQSWSATRRTQM